ncbi:MAG TPA: hypothetical protein VGX76_00360, partial [Pirellulales bacterium]|nr:hypothetical protein [Pirellulales bacterium]
MTFSFKPRLTWFTDSIGVLLIAWALLHNTAIAGGIGPIRVLIVDKMKAYGNDNYKPYENVLNSSRIIHYLNTHCAKDGNAPLWRHWDKDVKLTKENAIWQPMLDHANEAMAKAKNELPVLVIQNANGSREAVGALPANEDAALALL